MTLKIMPVSPKIGTEIPFPRYESEGAASIDLYACTDGLVEVAPGGRAVIPTGIAIALPSADYAALVFTCSGMGTRSGIALANGVGVIDSDYRGEIRVGLLSHAARPYLIRPGDKIAQLVIVPVIRAELEQVDSLDETARGINGLGSTGK